MDRCPLCCCPALEHPQDSPSAQTVQGPPVRRGRGCHSDKQLQGSEMMQLFHSSFIPWGKGFAGARVTRCHHPNPAPLQLGTRENLQLLPAMAGGEARPGLLLPSPRVSPAGMHPGGTGDNEKADGLPRAWMLRQLLRRRVQGCLGRVSGVVNPCSSTSFSPSLGWLRIGPPIRSSPCSAVPGVSPGRCWRFFQSLSFPLPACACLQEHCPSCCGTRLSRLPPVPRLVPVPVHIPALPGSSEMLPARPPFQTRPSPAAPGAELQLPAAPRLRNHNSQYTPSPGLHLPVCAECLDYTSQYPQLNYRSQCFPVPSSQSPQGSPQCAQLPP